MFNFIDKLTNAEIEELIKQCQRELFNRSVVWSVKKHIEETKSEQEKQEPKMIDMKDDQE